MDVSCGSITMLIRGVTMGWHTDCRKALVCPLSSCVCWGTSAVGKGKRQHKSLSMTKKVSVCIPSYNGARFIGATIKSVLDSVYQDFEIIISDDASTDSTFKVIESFHDGRISVYRNERNLGVVRNWNQALTKATGDYVGLLNHDDLYGPFWLTFAVHQLEKNPHIGWVGTAHHIIDADGRPLSVVSRFPATGEIPRTEAFLEIATLNGLGGFVARRELLEEMGYYDVDAGASADNDLFLRLAAKHSLYYSATYPHTAWRLHADNLTHRWSLREQIAEGMRMLDKIFGDPCLPQELQQYKNICFNNFLHKVWVYAKAHAPRISSRRRRHPRREPTRMSPDRPPVAPPPSQLHYTRPLLVDLNSNTVNGVTCNCSGPGSNDSTDCHNGSGNTGCCGNGPHPNSNTCNTGTTAGPYCSSGYGASSSCTYTGNTVTNEACRGGCLVSPHGGTCSDGCANAF